MNVLRKEGCNTSKVIPSANDGEGIRSPFMNIAWQGLVSTHKSPLTYPLDIIGARIRPCPVSCDTLIFLDKDPAYKTWTFTLVYRPFMTFHILPPTSNQVQNSVYPDCIKGFPNIKKAAENLATALKNVINCF